MPFHFLPDTEGHMVIYGTSGAGKSAALRTLAVSAGITPRGGPVHVYGLDFGSGALRMLEPLPHVGSVISGDDAERVARLFATLRSELDRRGDAYSAVGAATLTEYRALSGKSDEPRIVVLIDGFAAFRNDYEAVIGRSDTYNALQEVLSDGRAVGIHVVLSADRFQSIPSALNAMIQRRVVLRMSDTDAYNILNVPKDVLNPESVPGRAIVGENEAQIAIVGGTRSMKEQSLAIETDGGIHVAPRRAGCSAGAGAPAELPHRRGPRSPRRPARGRALRRRPRPVRDRADRYVRDRRPSREREEQCARGDHPADAAGAAGHTHAVPRVVALAGEERGGVDGFGGRRHQRHGGRRRDRREGRSRSQAGRGRRGRGGVRVVAAGDAAVRPGQAGGRGELLLLFTGDTSEWTSNFGLLGEIKQSRRGVVLQPETIDGELVLKAPLPRIGRGEFRWGVRCSRSAERWCVVQFPLVIPETV